MISDTQWEKIHKKYRRLMYAVAYKIGGDRVAHDFDDSNQELAITAMEAIDAYSRKTGKTFDDFFGTIPFDKYIKTCLWNKKNNLGNRIKKRYGVRNCVSLSANPEAFTTKVGTTYGSSSLEMPEVTISALDDVELNSLQQDIADLVIGDIRLIKPDGNINISKVSSLTNKPKTKVRLAIQRMKQQLKDYENETV